MNKKIIKKILPKKLWRIIKLAKTIPARIALKKSLVKAPYLPAEQIQKLLGTFPEVAKYEYDDAACQQRGQTRANFLAQLLPQSKQIKILELGCSDAMTSVALKGQGLDAVALDLVDQRLEVAKKYDIPFIQAPAENIPLEYKSIDFIFSYNALEHFLDPTKVLLEIHRILKPGGLFYADFDPLYFSPRGLHAYRKINIPYLQVLFKSQDLEQYAKNHQLNWSELPYVNAYPITKFRAIFAELKDKFQFKSYEEILDISGLAVIKTYPACFKKENLTFDNFIISGIKILLQKKS